MLTYRTGAAGAPSAARAMSEHLLQQTLSPEMAAMAEYYHQGLSPPTPAEAAAARYAAETFDGRFLDGELLDELVAREADRLAESGTDAEGRPLTRDAVTIGALGAFVAAGMVRRDEAIASLRRTGHGQTGMTSKVRGNASTAQRRGRVPARITPARPRCPAGI